MRGPYRIIYEPDADERLVRVIAIGYSDSSNQGMTSGMRLPKDERGSGKCDEHDEPNDACNRR